MKHLNNIKSHPTHLGPHVWTTGRIQEMVTMVTPTPDVLDQVETLVNNLDNHPLCQVCDKQIPEGHNYPIDVDCWSRLKPCTKCGASTGKKGHFDPKTKKQHSQCSSCFKTQLAAPKKVKPTSAPAPIFKPNTTVEHLWSRLKRAYENFRAPIVQSSPFVNELTNLLAQAEDASDREDVTRFDQNLNDYYDLRYGVTVFERLRAFDLDISRKRPEDVDNEWALIEMFVEALNSFDAGRFVSADQNLDSIIGLLEFERSETQRLESRDREIAELMEKWAKARANKEARLAYMAQQTQTVALSPVTNPNTSTDQPTRPVFADDQQCENCGGSTSHRFCSDCWGRLPMCPTCNERKVHVPQEGLPKENCLQCFRASLPTSEVSPVTQNHGPKPEDLAKKRDRSNRDREIRNQMKGSTNGGSNKGKNKGK